jgi:propanediol utilization protein
MNKIAVKTEVQVELASADAHRLGISTGYSGTGEIYGHYTLGHYVRIPGGKVLAIADKYNALRPV